MLNRTYRDETELLYSLYFALHYDLVKPVFIKWILSSSVNAPHPSAYAASGFWLNASYKRSTKSYLIVVGNTQLYPVPHFPKAMNLREYSDILGNFWRKFFLS